MTKKIEVSLDLGDKTNFKLNFSLIKSDAVSSYKDLGPSDTKNNVEVIGNIYENKELLNTDG